jgi:hypothetical protein
MYNSIFYEFGNAFEYEPEYLAVLSYATSQGFTLPKRDQNNKNNRKIKRLKEEGIFTELDVLYNFKQAAGLANFSTINWVNPGTYNVTQSNPALVPFFEADRGYKGHEASGSFFSTNYIPSTNATNAILEDMGVFFKTYDEISGSVAGTRNNSANNFQIRKANLSGTDVTSLAVATGGSGIFRFDNASHIVHAKNSSTHSYYINGTFNTSSIYASTTLSSFELTLFAYNNGGSKDQLFSGGIEYFALGSSYVKDKASQLASIFSY